MLMSLAATEGDLTMMVLTNVQDVPALTYEAEESRSLQLRGGTRDIARYDHCGAS